MPVNIVRFERLAYVSMVIDIIVNLSDKTNYEDISPYGVGAIMAVIAAIEFFVIWSIARRRKNWARWVYAVVPLLGVAGDVWSIVTFSVTPVIALLSALTSVLVLYCVYCLFTGDGPGWFQRRSPVQNGPVAA